MNEEVQTMSDRYPEVECYQCGRMKTALSYRSRCLTCETQRADANADENDELRARLAAAEADAEADVERWRPIETAPKDRPILALCRHDADPYFIEGGRRLTTYGAHAEGLTRVADGPHVVVWGGEYDGDEGVIPAWWFLNDGDFETVANPVAWMSIPATQPAGREVVDE